jgi:hypothetical protein
MFAYRLLVPALLLAISTQAIAQDDVPAAFRSLKPHQVVEAVMAERTTLGLTETQTQWLDSLHTAIRKEPHRYEGTPPGRFQYRHRPMVSRSRAYTEALSALTPDQRAQAEARFNDASYRLPAELQPRRAQAGPKPTETGAVSAAGKDPLQHHGGKAGPEKVGAASADPAKDPLQHRQGKATPAVSGSEADSGTQVNPITHKP